MVGFVTGDLKKDFSLIGKFTSRSMYLGTVALLPPNFEEVIQWLGKTYQGEDGCYYQEDKKGDELRTVYEGSYLELNATDNNIDTNVSSNAITSLTYAVMFKTNGHTGTQRLVWRQNASSTRGGLTKNTSGFIKFQNAGDVYGTGYDASDTTKQHFLIATLSGSDWALYDENGLVDSGSDSFGPAGVENMFIGGLNTGDYFDGSVSEARIFNRVVSEAERTAIFNGETIGDELLFYDIEAQTGNVALDKSGNDNHGTINGLADWQESIEVRSYKNENGYNLGLYFDGDDYTEYTTAVDSEWNMEFEVQFPLSAPAVDQFIWAKGTGTGTSTNVGVDIRSASSVRVFYYSGVTPVQLSLTVAAFFDGLKHTIKTRRVGNTMYLQVDEGTENSLTDALVPNNTSSTAVIGRRVGAANYFIGSYYSFKENGDEYIAKEAGVFERVSDGMTIGNLGAGGDFAIGYVPRLETAENIALPLRQQLDVSGSVLDQYGRARNDTKIIGTNTLTSNGTDNYVDTEIINTKEDKIEIVGSYLTIPAGNSYVYGSTGAVANQIYFGITPASKYRAVIGGVSDESADAEVVVGKVVTQTFENGIFSVDGVEKADVSAGIVNSSQTSHLFSLNFTSWLGIDFEMHSCKIWQNDVLVRHYVMGEGAGASIFDKVTGQSFAIEGFTPDVWTTDDCTRTNNLLDGFNYYVESESGDQYIDTGFIPTQNTRVEFGCKISTLNTADKIFGCRTTGAGFFFLGVSTGDISRLYGIANSDSGELVTFSAGSADIDFHDYVFDAKNGEVFRDGISIGTMIVNSFTLTATMHLYEETGGGSTIEGMMFNYFRIYEDDILVQNLIAQDNGTFLDLVTGDIKYNAGTGELVSLRLPSTEADKTIDVFGSDILYPGTTNGHNGSENCLQQPNAPEIYAVPFALAFDGVGNYVPTGILFNETSFTINFDGEIEDFTANDGLLNTTNDSASTGFSLFINTGNVLSLKANGIGYGSNSGYLETGRHTYSLVVDGTSVKFFKDGVLDKQLTMSSAISTTTSPLEVGRLYAGVDNFYNKASWLSIEIVGFIKFVPIKRGDTLGTQTATANGFYDKVSDTICYNAGIGELGVHNGLMTYCYDDMQPDYEYMHYWFNDVFSKDPIKFNTVMYKAQQLGLLTGGNLHNALNFVKALEKLYDSNPVLITYIDGVPGTVLEEGVK